MSETPDFNDTVGVCSLGCFDGAKTDGLRCPECKEFFCDNCYDTDIGDGCEAHSVADGTNEQCYQVQS